MDGLGVALAKKNWVINELAQGKLVRPFAASIPVEFAYFIAYPEEREDDPRINTFVNWVRSEVTQDEAASAEMAKAGDQIL